MSIMAAPTQRQQDQGRSRGYLDAVMKMVRGERYSDPEHEIAVLSRFFNNTKVAAEPKGSGPDFFEKYAGALGRQGAVEFLTEFNEACESYGAELKAKKAGAKLRFHPGGQERVLEALEKLEKATREGNFFMPYQGMGQPPRDRSRCTGR